MEFPEIFFFRDEIVNVLSSDHSKVIPTGNEGCDHLDNAYKISLGMKRICEDQSKRAADGSDVHSLPMIHMASELLRLPMDGDVHATTDDYVWMAQF